MSTEPLNASPSSRVVLGALALILSSGCSLFNPSLRPVPGADRNLTCAIEYRPDPTHDGPDLLFLAAANPYKWEEGYMNPLEPLVHTIIGPGRYLSAPVEVQGAVCDSTWQAGHRLPMWFTDGHYLLCRRQALAEVRFAVQTKWGACEQVISESDDRPRCDAAGNQSGGGLRFLSQTTCPLEGPSKKR